jgi:hypothetical protein
MIYLRGRDPVAAGNHMSVYGHPDDATVLIKVVRLDVFGKSNPRWDFLRGRRRRFLHLKNFMRVLEEQVAVLARDGKSSSHLEEVIGLVDTDLGPGLMVRCETFRGEMAPTLDKLYASGKLGEYILEPLEVFFSWLENSPVIASDLNTRNLVLSDRQDGKLQIVMIDGYGENAAIPLKSWSRELNRRDKRQKANHVRKRLNLPTVGKSA